MVQFASYLRRVLCKTRLIFLRINGPNDSYVSSVNIFHLKFNRVDFIERTILDILYSGDASNGSNDEGDRK